MSILIKGATLPDSCWDCEADFAYQIGCELWQDYEEFCERRHPNCPLIEIPTPHGRLIDIEKLREEFAMKKNICKECDSFKECDNKIYSKSEICANFIWVPTILEAEE